MDRLKVLPNERVDIADFRASAGGDLVLFDQIRRVGIFILPSGRTTGLALTGARIIDGFTAALAPPIVTLTRGSGFMPLYEDGVTTYGLMLGTEDPPTATLDFSADGNDTYTIWVRALFSDATFENRVFWNPAGAPTEVIGNMSTRRVQGWQAMKQSSSAAPPGHGDWVPVWQATKAAGVVTAINDYRHFFFEGSKPDTYAEEWGGGVNDRNANRALYGVKDLHMFAQMVRRQLADIIGVKHYTVVPRHLTDLAVQHKAGGSHGGIIADSVNVVSDVIDEGHWQFGINASFGATSVTNRGTKIHGHVVRPHEFFDDFNYIGGVANLIHDQLANMPWGFRAIGGGALGAGDNYAIMAAGQGGMITLHAKNAAQQGIEMISGYNPDTTGFKGWWNIASKYAAAMWRFLTPADITEMEILLGLLVSGDELANPAVYVEYVHDSGGGGTGGKLQARVRGLGPATGAAVDLVDPLLANTYYTVRMWSKNTTQMSFQVNNGAPIDAAVAGGDVIQSASYCLHARCAVSSMPTAVRDLAIDQAFACDGILAADME